jgi:hypothetical protein
MALGLPFRLRNPIVIVWLFSAPILFFRVLVGPHFLVEGGISNQFFLKAVWIEIIHQSVSSACLILFLLFCQKYIVRLVRPFLSRTEPFRHFRSNYYALGLVFLLFGFLVMATLASQKFGIANWVANPRHGYQFNRVGQGHLYALAVNCMAVGSGLALLFSFRLVALFFAVIPTVGLVYLLGSKAFFLQLATFITIVMFFRRSKLAGVSAPVLISCAGIAMLLNFAQAGFATNFENIAKYFDYFSNSTAVVQLLDQGSLGYFYGDILMSSFWSAVPRVVFPDKPYIYGILHLNETLWPGLAKLGHTPAFTSGIDLYADFGWLGVCFGPIFSISVLISGVIYSVSAEVYKKFTFKMLSASGLLSVLLAFAPGVLSFLVYPWNVMWIATTYMFLIVSRPVRR